MEYIRDLSDFRPLMLPATELAILRNLNRLSSENGVEYAMVFSDEKESGIYTSDRLDRVEIPHWISECSNVRLFHSHTNRSALSVSDLILLIRPNVSEVCVVTIDGNIFRAINACGLSVTEEDYWRDIAALRNEVDLDMLDHPEFFEWSIEIRNYMAIKEQMFRVARLYDWGLEGGRI